MHLVSATDSKEEFLDSSTNILKLRKKETDLTEVDFAVPYESKEIPSVLTYVGSCSKDRILIVLTHGAGGDLNTPQLKAIRLFLASQNYVVVCFTCKGLNIKYRIKVFGKVLSYVNEKYSPKMIFVGGRSMGARAAAMLVSDEACDSQVFNKLKGVVCLSYPLHKVGDDSELRKEPLLNAKKPIFFLSGSNDEMCKKGKLENVLKSMKAPYKLQWLEGYDHSAKSNQNFKEDDYISAFQEIVKWCQQIQKTNS
ncbi:testis-expressed protein 30 isoform X2 [Parasteatoda tepidariorum]|nr:testis-expressed protein 30 isoform X2 [Parasteatoda tepidariorum]XP_015908205.1 testis-expressed protein 30 isoform X2 [Parasteatoda tepidariorum]